MDGFTKMINKLYLTNEVISQMQEFFEKEGYIQLVEFKDILSNEVKKKISSENFKEDYKPLFHKRKILNLNNIKSIEFLKLFEFFKSTEFLDYIEELVQTEIELKEIRLCKYTHSDFKIINDKSENEEVIDVYFDLTYDKFKKNMGGYMAYTDRKEELFYLHPQFNALTILYKPPNILRYLKYINNKADKKSIYRFEMKFEIL